MDFKKNKKMIMLAVITAAICILLLLVSSSAKKRNGTGSVQQPQPGATLQQQGDNPDLQETWARYDDENKIIRRNPAAYDATPSPSAGTPDSTAESPAREPEYGNYPAPSFVSNSGDTLIYKNGIYIRVDWVKPPEEKPDTLILNGKTYIELLETESKQE